MADALPLIHMGDLDSLVIASGVRHCCHLPRGRNARELGAALALPPHVHDGGIRVATNPCPTSIWTRLSGTPTVSKWMASKLGCAQADAKARISQLPVAVHEQFNCNAYNPMRFLGFVLAADSNPAILIYETSGMDPRGRDLLHAYATHVYTSGTLIHASSVSIDVCERPGDCQHVDI